MQPYPGVAPFTPLSTPPGKGVFPTPDVVTTDPRSAANLMAAVQALTDRSNWEGWRAIDWQHVGTASYTPQGTVQFLPNGGNGWYFGCLVRLMGTTTIGGTTTISGTTTIANVPSFSVDPAANADVGRNALTSLGQAKAWAEITTTGAGGVTMDDGYNIASVTYGGTGTSSYAQVTFAHAMASSTYAVIAESDATTLIHAKAYLRTANGFRIKATDYAGTALDIGAMSATKINVLVFGRQ